MNCGRISSGGGGAFVTYTTNDGGLLSQYYEHGFENEIK